MTNKLCACGCGEAIEPQPHHKYKPPRYKPNHFQKTGDLRRGVRTSTRRVQPNTPCACGCGLIVPEFALSGAPRYIRGNGPYFSVSHRPVPKGTASPRFKGRYVNSYGYVRIYAPDHPGADKRGHVLEHRLVWERANGRRPQSHEHVHHINGDPSDNRPENLVALTVSQHMKEHERNPNKWATQDQLRAAGLKGAAARWGKK